MSRARLFKRAADWLKNCVKTKEKIAAAKDRQRAFRFAFGQLEERVVLDADFTFDGIDLALNNYSAGEDIEISETATHVTFTLGTGVWNGVDFGDLAGATTSTLSLAKTSAIETITSDGSGIDLNFGGVDLTSLASLSTFEAVAGDVTQSGSIDASLLANFVIDANNVSLLDLFNDFSTVDLTADVAEIVESDGFSLNNATLSDRLTLETVAGDLGLTGTIVAPNGLLLISGDAIAQSAGTIDAATLLVESVGDAVLDQLNSIGTGLPAGVIAGESGGDFVVTNTLDTLVGTVTINRNDGSPVSLTGIDALNVKLTAINLLVNAATTATENIVLDSDNGVTQNADGILKAAGLVLAGEGDFDLTQDNEIGTLVDPGKFAATVLGSINLTNLYGLMVAKISCWSDGLHGCQSWCRCRDRRTLVMNTSANNGDVESRR